MCSDVLFQTVFFTTSIFLFLSSIFIQRAAASASHAIFKYKAPNSQTPSRQIIAWQTEDASLHSYIAEVIPAVLEHTGSEAFDEHLRGVQAILRGWDSPSYLCNAGLFHSIYGTEGFQGFSLALSERDAIRELIGKKAERLCWIFCMVDRSTVDETVFKWKFVDTNDLDHIDAANSTFVFLARPELGRFSIHLNREEWLDFIELSLADWLEQVEGAAETSSSIFMWNTGEAYAYRRTAYARMADILIHERTQRLATIVKEIMADVYGRESATTRHLVQVRTPPMSEAAHNALNALKSAGEDLFLDFTPQPQISCS